MSFIDTDGIVDQVRLDTAVRDGHVRRSSGEGGPGHGMSIYTYTQKAVIDGVWNDVTRAARGLIVCDVSGEVIARGPMKFFNSHESHAPDPGPDTYVEAHDKMDGSMCTLVRGRFDWFMATKGSFASDQAKLATEILHAKYGEWLHDPPAHDGLTFVFEVVGPSNRIVLQYDENDLVLLGVVNNISGRWMPAATIADSIHWPGSHAELVYAGPASGLAGVDREDKEGVVVFIPRGESGEQLVKIKQADYLRLHKIVTGLSERAVWQHLSEGKPLADLLEQIPDEFHDWVKTVAERMRERVADLQEEVQEAYLAAASRFFDIVPTDTPLDTSAMRKHFVAAAKEGERFNQVLMYRDEHWERLNDSIWKEIRPATAKSLWQQGEVA